LYYITQSHIVLIFDHVNPEDCSDGDTTVDVGGAIQRIETNAVLPTEGRVDEYGLLVLFRHKNAGAAAADERLDKDLVGEHIELLLLLTLQPRSWMSTRAKTI
jgi:hypothetical protein